MQYTSEVYEWIKKKESRRKILMTLSQPLTAGQISRKAGIPVETCSYILVKCTGLKLLKCLNPKARNSRLYWLTYQGIQCQRWLCRDQNTPYQKPVLEDIDWELYGWICFRHRSVILKTITEPMQPARIKRYIRYRFPQTKISSNNVRDIIKLFLTQELVRPVSFRKKVHPRYELTDTGIKLRQLLLQAERLA